MRNDKLCAWPASRALELDDGLDHFELAHDEPEAVEPLGVIFILIFSSLMACVLKFLSLTIVIDHFGLLPGLIFGENVIVEAYYILVLVQCLDAPCPLTLA